LQLELPQDSSWGVDWALVKIEARNSYVSNYIGDFKTKANGWLNYPNASIGYRIRRSLLLTLKVEGTINLSYFSKVGDQVTSYSHNTYTGWATSLILEQPFYKKKNFIIGFKAQYTNFFWQTWSLYETFDRKLFYPEVIVGFIL